MQLTETGEESSKISYESSSHSVANADQLLSRESSTEPIERPEAHCLSRASGRSVAECS